LDIRVETSWINELALLPDRKCHLSAEVLTEQVVLLMVPLSPLERLTEASPRLAQNIIQHTVRQLESYQKLWMQS
jgi:CRP-like cAMP-binding protein